MTAFASFFRLRDAGRGTLELSPEEDASFYIDLDEVLPKVEQNLRSKPRFAVFGEIGTGKSHLLRYIEKELSHKLKFEPAFIMLSGFDRRSGFERVHTLVMQALHKPLEGIFKNGLVNTPGLSAWIEKQPKLSPDLQHAFRTLSDLREANKHASVWAWLKGTGISFSQANKAGFSGRLIDLSGPAQLVDIWKQLGELYYAFSNPQHRLLLLFDEGQSIQDALSDDAQHQLGDGFRQLLDPDNRSIGAVFGLNLPKPKRMHPFMRADVLRRYDADSVKLKPLADSERIATFYRRLWAHLAPGAPDLLHPEALDFVGERLVDLREWQGVHAAGSINRIATQADLLKVLDYIARSALEHGRKPPISTELVQQWFGGIGQ